MRNTLYALALLALLNPRDAAAHASLVRSSPSSGAVLTQAPSEIRLSFNEAIEGRFSSVTVSRSDGQKVQAGRASVDPQKRSELVVSLPALRPGKYQVSWRATSADSHRIEGRFAFEVRP
jgi:methionine-rich copper-binding protein CopC